MVPPTLSRVRSIFAAFAVFALAGCAATTVIAHHDVRGHLLEGALHGQSGAYLTVRDAASRVEVTLADLPGRLYRVSTPADSGLSPRVTGPPGRVRLDLVPTGNDGPDAVTIVLNRAVRWDIRLPAGAGEQHLDLASGRVARVDVGAAGLVTMLLPRPRGTVPVTFTGGAGSVEVRVPRSTMTLLRLRGGAGEVRTPWRSSRGSRAGAVLAARGWTGSADRYAVEARAGLGTVTVR